MAAPIGKRCTKTVKKHEPTLRNAYKKETAKTMEDNATALPLTNSSATERAASARLNPRGGSSDCSGRKGGNRNGTLAALNARVNAYIYT